MNNKLDAPTETDLIWGEVHTKLICLTPNEHVKINGHIVKMNENEMYIVDGDNVELFFYQVYSFLTKNE